MWRNKDRTVSYRLPKFAIHKLVHQSPENSLCFTIRQGVESEKAQLVASLCWTQKLAHFILLVVWFGFFHRSIQTNLAKGTATTRHCLEWGCVKHKLIKNWMAIFKKK